ncbi:MAG TPA: hypothetical protein VME20_12355 [Acidimicrobiales bacterium]|nr:hypothetical protein [Acidimicrobiales bacterium]
MASLKVAVAATKSPWSTALRAHVRDHGQGVDIEIVMDGTGLRRLLPKLDVLVLDDVMRALSSADLAKARDFGAHVIGVWDAANGMGRQYLLALGAEELLPASSPAADLFDLISQVRPRDSVGASRERGGSPRPTRAIGARKHRGLLTAWTKVSGGAGLTELVVGAAEHFSQSHPVLLVEAEELSPVLVSRLARAPEGGLPWALARARQGMPAVASSLSGERGDGTEATGHFDILCAAPGSPTVLSPNQLERVLEEALGSYAKVLVETGWLIGSPSARERFSSTRSVLQLASAVCVVASCDPEGAARLVQWKASALLAGISAPCWAVFGRARLSRHQKDHLRALVQSNTGGHPFAGIGFIPEDDAVQTARWNGELVTKGSWHRAMRELAAAIGTGAMSQPPSADLGSGHAPERRPVTGASDLPVPTAWVAS